MALTFSTGMTVDDTAQAITNFGSFAIAGAQDRAASIITSHGAMGANCVGSASDWITPSSVVIMYDYFTSHASTALNLSTVGNEVIAIWFHLADPGIIDTLANGGVYIIASSSVDTGATVPTAYRRWFVSGKDVLRTTAKGPWYLAMIDTRKAASVADVGTPDLTAIRRFGIGSKLAITSTVGGPPPENLFLGGVMHGRPIYQVIGDGATTATWNDILTHSLTTQQNGLIEDHGGSYKLSCGIRFGSTTQAATTTFSDATNLTFVFKRNTYYNAGEVDALNYADYYLVDAQGAASFKTSVTLGTVVGSGDNRQGVKGSAFLTSDQTNITIKADFTSANLTAANMYGTRWTGFKGGLKFDGSTIGLIITNTFQRSGEIDLGAVGNGATMLNCTLIDPEGGTANNYGLKLPSVHNIKLISFITSGTPTTQHMLDLSSSGTYTVTMDALKFFGDYSSATLWHGDMSSATLTTATGAASNGATPTGAEFDKTGNASNTITILNTVTVKVTCFDAVTLAVIQNVRVLLTADTGGPLPFQASVTITSSGTTATVTHTAHGRKSGEKMLIKGANQPEYNGIQTITVTTVNAYTYTISGSPATPATGTITSTMIILDGLTDVNGVIQDTGFNFPGVQPVTGRARKSTSAPLYATAPLVGSITTAGATLSAFLVPD